MSDIPKQGEEATSDADLWPDDRPEIRDLKIEDYVALMLFWLLGALVFAQFALRYAFNYPIGWSEEISRYLLICVTFFGSAMAVRKGNHVAIEILRQKLPPFPAKVVSSVVDLIQIAVFAWCTWLAFSVTQLVRTERMASVNLSMSVLYAVVVLALAVVTLRTMHMAWRRWTVD